MAYPKRNSCMLFFVSAYYLKHIRKCQVTDISDKVLEAKEKTFYSTSTICTHFTFTKSLTHTVVSLDFYTVII